VLFVLRHVRGQDADATAGALGVPRLPGGGATVNFLVGKIGRDPAAWSDPMSFAPERFMPGGEGEGAEDDAVRRREAHLPGPRAGGVLPRVLRGEPGEGVRVVGGGRRGGRSRRVPRVLLHRHGPPATRAPRAAGRGRGGSGAAGEVIIASRLAMSYEGRNMPNGCDCLRLVLRACIYATFTQTLCYAPGVCTKLPVPVQRPCLCGRIDHEDPSL
jgi:hypothetical protein